MNASSLDNALWAASLIGHVALVFVLVLKKRWKTFPVLTAFFSYEVFTTILLFFVSRHASRHAYFFTFWTTAFLNYIFQVAIIIEVARDILRPTGTWLTDARRMFLGWGTAGLLAAAALAFQIGPTESRGLALWDTRITVFTSLLTAELFAAIALVASRLGLQWRSRVVAVGQGIFIWAFFSLLEDFAHTTLGWDREFAVYMHIREIVYLSVLIYWMFIFWLPERARAPLSPEMRTYLIALHERVQYDLKSR